MPSSERMVPVVFEATRNHLELLVAICQDVLYDEDEVAAKVLLDAIRAALARSTELQWACVREAMTVIRNTPPPWGCPLMSGCENKHVQGYWIPREDRG